MRKFREVVEQNNLFDPGFQSNPFTFSNKRLGSMEVKATIDRAFVSGDWLTKFPNARMSHVATISSDHFLLVLDLHVTPVFSNKKSFKFESMWLRSTDFNGQVTKFWRSSFLHNVL